jgi:hypothetical protein
MINLKSGLGKSLMSIALSASLVVGGAALMAGTASAHGKHKARNHGGAKAKANTKNKIGQNGQQGNSNTQTGGNAVATGSVGGSVVCIDTFGPNGGLLVTPIAGVNGNFCASTSSGGTATAFGPVLGGQFNNSLQTNLGNQAGGTATAPNSQTSGVTN